jgi:hypothetical protein
MASQNPQLPPRFRNYPHANAGSNSTPSTRTFRYDTLDPQITPQTRKRMSPVVLLLVVLAGIVAVFGAGNLPQLDIIFDSWTNALRSHNDYAVQSIVDSGWIILIAGIVILVVIVLLLWRNAVRRKASDG